MTTTSRLFSSSGDGREAARYASSSIVLTILLGSLVVIYLIAPQTWAAGAISALLLAICLTLVLYGSWRGLAVVAVITGVVSVAAAAFVGRLYLGTFGSVLVSLLWLGVLLVLFRSVRNNVIIVPRDRAILIQNTFTGELTEAPAPIAAPPIPGLERIAAEIPKYTMTDDVEVPKVNTSMGHSIDRIVVQVHYNVSAPRKVLRGIPNRSQVEREVAAEFGVSLEQARRQTTYWERLLNRQIETEIDDIVREVVFSFRARNPDGTDRPSGAVDVYNNRVEIARDVFDRLSEYVAQRGITIQHLQFESIDVPEDRFRFADPRRMDKETYAELVKAQREATRLREVLRAAADIEKQRMEQIIEALQKIEAPVTADVIINAIRAASDWVIDGEYTLMSTEAPKAVGGDKRDAKDGPRK